MDEPHPTRTRFLRVTKQTGVLRSADSTALLLTNALGRGLPHLAQQTLPQLPLDGCRYRLGGRLGTLGVSLMSPRPLTEPEQNLINLYGYCSLGMTPQQFYSKWQVNHEAIAFICTRSISTVRGWFRRGGNYRRPRATDMRHLALMDFLLEHYEDIPPELLNLLCPCDYLRYRAKPDRNQ